MEDKCKVKGVVKPLRNVTNGEKSKVMEAGKTE